MTNNPQCHAFALHSFGQKNIHMHKENLLSHNLWKLNQDIEDSYFATIRGWADHSQYRRASLM